MNIYWQYVPDDIDVTLWNDGDLYQYFRHSDFKYFDDKLLDGFFADINGIFVTLNPMVANYLNDEVAKNIVFVKTSSGFKRLGDIPEIQYKFKALGAGEILCDTDFSKL